jgi:maltooligosyltrehalose trehalohydrolase
MKRMHAMPFGAELREGTARFRLWAPACEHVRVELGDEVARRQIAMAPEPGGWHSLTVKGLGAGTLYAFHVDDRGPVPDPASRCNPWDVNGPSALVDPAAYEWDDAEWPGRPWHEAVVYEMHVGTFTPEGTFRAAAGKLDYLVSVGVTAIEVMPVADFAGRRNWGYDGVLPFAPDSVYGKPEDFKRFVDEAHARGIMVLLDVVYNHFGPEGNHLARYAPQFFNPAHQTPWGAAINFDAESCRPVRDFFVHNATYWIDEFHLDGLRLDAVHAIMDDSPKHIVTEIAEAIARGPGRPRHVHLVLENDRNEAHFLDRSARPHGTAQWNDDFHHAAHVLVAGEADGYYADYAGKGAWYLGRTLAEGFAYQGDPSAYRKGEKRGEPSRGLPPEAFVDFLQNHDQIGNRAMGERLPVLASAAALRLATATLLLAPPVPMLFQGEEFAARTPFLYFCDFQGELAKAVREGRRKEFASFERFRDPAARERIPDPNAEETFLASRIQWDDATRAVHADALEHHRLLLAIRQRNIVPHIAGRSHAGTFEALGPAGVAVDWVLGDGARLHLRANFGAVRLEGVARPAGIVLHGENGPPGSPAWGGPPGSPAWGGPPGSPAWGGPAEGNALGPWSGIWTLEPA